MFEVSLWWIVLSFALGGVIAFVGYRLKQSNHPPEGLVEDVAAQSADRAFRTGHTMGFMDHVEHLGYTPKGLPETVSEQFAQEYADGYAVGWQEAKDFVE